MGQRREVAAGSYGALLRDDRMNSSVEKGNQLLQQLEADSTEALGENVGAQQNHGANLRLAQRLSDTARMASDKIDLQVGKLIGRHAHVRELAEACVDAVDRLAGA